MQKGRFSLVIHATVWIFYVVFNYLLAYFQQPGNTFILDYLTKYLLVVPVFYLNAYWTLPSFAQNGKWVKFLAAQVALVAMHFTSFVAAYRYILPGLFNYPPIPLSTLRIFPRSFWWYCTFLLYAFGFWYAVRYVERQKRVNQLQQENLLMELNFLKSQINSHFLYNTLNTLMAQALPLSGQLADNINKLSQMMRYSIESVDQGNGTVPLQNEISQLKNYIDIHQMRFLNTLQIHQDFCGYLEDHLIPPLVLITVVENAFKYGDLKNPQYPLIIRLTAEPDRLRFQCVNKKKRYTNNFSHGIGLINIRKRLDFAFPDNYDIKIDNTEENYAFELTIND